MKGNIYLAICQTELMVVFAQQTNLFKVNLRKHTYTYRGFRKTE